MNENNTSNLNLFWVIALVIAVYMLYSGGQQYTTGEPVESWIADVVVGVSFLLFCVVIYVGYRLEGGHPSDHVGLTDWILLFLFGSWIVIGVLFYVLEYRLPRMYLFSAMGALGVVVMAYAMWTSRN